MTDFSFSDLIIADTIAVILGLWLYDWVFDELTDRIWKKVSRRFIKKRKVLDRQGIS
jgi:hypothetical protein